MIDNKRAVERLKKYLNGCGWELTQRLQRVVCIIERELRPPGLAAISINDDGTVTVTYATWYTEEYGIRNPNVTFPAWYLFATREEIDADLAARKEEEERAKKAEQEAQLKADRKKLFEELKKEFGEK